MNTKDFLRLVRLCLASAVAEGRDGQLKLRFTFRRLNVKSTFDTCYEYKGFFEIGRANG